MISSQKDPILYRVKNQSDDCIHFYAFSVAASWSWWEGVKNRSLGIAKTRSPAFWKSRASYIASTGHNEPAVIADGTIAATSSLTIRTIFPILEPLDADTTTESLAIGIASLSSSGDFRQQP
ncbi:MAG: hypothetical protein CMJ78_17925 [Planctomycetaceae bacterium]|nr:hypothetical protein [Planctomycetaceae bacterium]